MASGGQTIPLQCECCNKSFSGQVPALQHFQSAAHKKREQVLRQSAATNVDVKMCNICNITCDTWMMLQKHEASPRHLAMVEKKQRMTQAANQMGPATHIGNVGSGYTAASGYTPPVNGMFERPKGKTENKQYDFDGNRGFCYLCNIELTSMQHASQHLNGSKHKKKQALPTMMDLRQTVAVVPDSFHTTQRNALIDQALPNRYNQAEGTSLMGNEVSKPLVKGVKMDEKLYCEICDVRTDNQMSMIDHLRSTKHETNLLNKSIQLSRSSSLASVPDSNYTPDVNYNEYVSYTEINEQLSALGIAHNREASCNTELVETLKKETFYEQLKENTEIDKFKTDTINLNVDSMISESSFVTANSSIEGQEMDEIQAKPFSVNDSRILTAHVSDFGSERLVRSLSHTNERNVLMSRSVSVPYPTETIKNNLRTPAGSLINSSGQLVGVGRGGLASKNTQPVQLITKINNLVNQSADDGIVNPMAVETDVTGQTDDIFAKPLAQNSIPVSKVEDEIIAKTFSEEPTSSINPFEDIVAKHFASEPNLSDARSGVNYSSTETNIGGQLSVNSTQYQYIGNPYANYLPTGGEIPRTTVAQSTAQNSGERDYYFDGVLNRGHCRLCNIALTSKAHMEQHLGGRKHNNAKELKKGLPFQSAYNINLFCDICLVPFSGTEQREMHLKSDKHKKKVEQKCGNASSGFYFCDICKVECSGEVNYKQHLIGEKHKKKMPGYVSEQIWLQCDICGCTMNSQQQLWIHKKSKHPANENTLVNAGVMQVHSPLNIGLQGDGMTKFVPGNDMNSAGISNVVESRKPFSTPLEDFLSLELFPKGEFSSAENIASNSSSEHKSATDVSTFITPEITTKKPVQINPRYAVIPQNGFNSDSNGNNSGNLEANNEENSGNGIKRSQGSALAHAIKNRSKGTQKILTSESPNLSQASGSASHVGGMPGINPDNTIGMTNQAIFGSSGTQLKATSHHFLDKLEGVNPFADTHPYYCHTCRAPANTRESYENHLQGKRHLSKVGTEPAPERPHLEACELGTEFKLQTKSTPRNYQWELYYNAMKSDTVCFLPTGTGKTMVSVMVMSVMLEVFPTRPVLFVVDKVLLVLQQSKYITAELGEFQFTRYNPESQNLQKVERRSLKIATLCMDRQSTQGVPLWKHDIIVVTAAFCQNLLEGQVIRWEDFSLIIFDEAHHCDKKHPFNVLLYKHHLPLYGVKRRPKILGLTASPAGKDTVPATIAMLEKLVANMGGVSMNIVQKYKQTLSEFQSNAQIIIRPQPDQFNEIVAMFITELQIYLVYCYLRLVPISDIQNYVNWKNFVTLSSDAETVRKCAKNCIEANLETFQICLMNIQCKDVKDKYKVRNLLEHTKSMCMALNSLLEGGVPCAVEEISEMEKEEYNFEFAKTFHLPYGKLQAIYDNTRETLETGRTGEQQFGSHISRLIEELTNSLDIDWSCRETVKPMALVLVKERATVHQITRILQNNEVMQRMNLRVASVVGHGKTGASDAAGMTVNKQKRILEEIKQYKYQVIIATSVAEEGVDWPECELVVSLYPPSTLTALVQMRGRARKKNSKFVVLCSSQEEGQKIEDLKQRENNMIVASEYLFQKSLQS